LTCNQEKMDLIANANINERNKKEKKDQQCGGNE
jgi:hypothetical protein